MHKETNVLVFQLFQWNEMVDECLRTLAKQPLLPLEIIYDAPLRW